MKSEGCYACAVQCKRSVKVEGKYNASPEYGGPEYETVASLGSYCGIDNLAAIAQGNEMCNRYGLDTISAGVCIAFAMELVEKGTSRQKIPTGSTRFGNADSMLVDRKDAGREVLAMSGGGRSAGGPEDRERGRKICHAYQGPRTAHA
jgi:aldehyde:ferredoxin oxidoreductase